MNNPTVNRRLRRAPGFSLMEMGIAIGCIAVLLLVVFQAKGFVDNSKLNSTVQTVKTIHKGAVAWAERRNQGRNYTGIAGPPANNALGNLCDFPAGKFPLVEVRGPGVDCGYLTAWDRPLVVSTPFPTELEVRFCLPTVALAEDAKAMLANTCTATFTGVPCLGCVGNCMVSCKVN